ncbi:MAG: hypothetical protein HY807_06625 [Nitrospirae bacterium]|nr:hypothetical protein [Nitrospirota bacterium]
MKNITTFILVIIFVFSVHTVESKITTLSPNTSEPTALTKEIDELESENTYLDILNKYASLIGAVGGIFTAITAFIALLFSAKEFWIKPKLKLFYKENKGYPYTHELKFNPYRGVKLYKGKELSLFKPGLSVRLYVYNKGNATAKKAQAMIEKIEFLTEDGSGEVSPTRYYHPSKVKWSGEINNLPDYSPVDIIPKSFYFLDIFFAINETKEAVYNVNKRFYGFLPDDTLMSWIAENQIEDDIFWNVWIMNPEERGVPSKHYEEGMIKIHFIINAENSDPLRFIAHINWSKEKWNKPDIKIKQGKYYIDEDFEVFLMKGGSYGHKV